jgi:hypothetical protein
MRCRVSTLGGVLLTLGVALASVASATTTEDAVGVRTLIDQGQIHATEWKVEVRGDSGVGGYRRPCITVMLSPVPGVASNLPGPAVGDTACREVDVVPNILAVTNEVTAPPTTVLAMGFARHVHRVRLNLRGRPQKTIRLATLPESKARQAHVKAFKYGVAAFSGNFCLQGLVGLARDGTVVERSSAAPCG